MPFGPTSTPSAVRVGVSAMGADVVLDIGE